MPFKKNLKETTYGRDLDNRNDPKWAHPELTDVWVAGPAELVDQMCDDNIPLEKRKKDLARMWEMAVTSVAPEDDAYATVERFEAPGCKEEPETGTDVYVVVPREKKAEKRPVIFYVMGGAFFMQVHTVYPDMITFGRENDAVVVAPMYRTLLDGQYPAQINDLHAGYQWMLDHADELNIDPDRVVILGTSTGAHLALGLCFRLKRYGITPRGCVVNDPMTDDRNMYESSKIIKEPCDAVRTHTMFVNYVGFENCGSNYIGPEAFAGHATVDECKGLCPIFMHIGESDQDRDGVMAFAAKLYQAKVPTEVHQWYGAAHAVLWNAPKDMPLAKRYHSILNGNLSDCLNYDLRRPWAND